MKGKDKDNDIEEAMKHLLDSSLDIASEMYKETIEQLEQQIISLKNREHLANERIKKLEKLIEGE